MICTTSDVVRAGEIYTTQHICGVVPWSQRHLKLPQTQTAVYSDDVVELLLLKLTDWLRPPWCFLRCLTPPSVAGKP